MYVFSYVALVDLPVEDSEVPKFSFGFGRADSSNRIFDFQMNSRGNSAFTLLNPGDDQGISRIWNSHGFNASRPPTIQCIQTDSILGSKFLQSPHQDVEERKDDGELEKPKNRITSSTEHLIAQEYFSKSGTFDANHSKTADRKN